MIYNEDSIKYCLFSWDSATTEHIESHTSLPLHLTGLFNWSFALRGDIAAPQRRDQFDKYNLVHINVTPKNLFLIGQVKEKLGPDTKLLVNVDHAVDMWSKSFPWPHLFAQELSKADFIFAVEPLQAKYLCTILNRYVPCIPHPADIAALSQHRRQDSRSRRVLTSVHRYDQNYILPHFALAGLDDSWCRSVCGVSSFENLAPQIFNEIIPSMQFHEFIPAVADTFIALESYTIHSYGRFTIEMAALGIPTIGSACVASQRVLFPDLIIPQNDFIAARALLRRLIDVPEFYASCALTGISRSVCYDFPNCRSLLFDYLNGAQP